MTVLYTGNFDSDTSGAIAPGWTAKVGTWAVGTVSPVSGVKSFGSTSNADGDFALYTGIPARGDMKVTASCKLTSPAPNGTNNYYIALRMDSGYLNGYLLAAETDSTENRLCLYKRTNGAFAAPQTTPFSFTGWVTGDVMMCEASVVGILIEFRVWKSSASRPSSPSLSITDSSFSSGYTGLYRAGISRPAGSIDDFVVDDMQAAADTTRPTMNGTLDVSGQTSSGYTLTWQAASDNVGVAGYMLDDGSGAYSDLGNVLTKAVTGKNASTTYTPRVYAYDAAGNTALTPLTASATTTASAPTSVTFPVTDASIYFSPYNWYSDGTGAMQANNVKAGSTFAWLNMRGGYLKFKATVGASGTITLGINTATLSNINAAGCPQIAWSIDNGAIQSRTLITGDTTLSLATGLTAGTHDVFVWFRGVYVTQDGTQTQNYTTPNNRFQVTQVALSAGGTLSAPTIRSKKIAVYGDSITEGDLSNNGPRSATSQDASLTYGWLLAEALDAEVGIIGFYGMQWSWFDTTWANYAQGLSRLVAGKLSPIPDYITINYGENDGNPGPSASAVTSTLAAVSASAPTAKIINIIPFSGRARTNLTAATLPTNGYRIDLAPPEMVNGGLIWSYDGQHPNQRGHANLSALLVNKVNNLPAAGLATRNVSITFGLDSATAAANLTGAKVAFYDEPTPDLYTVARYQTSAETMDASGVLTFSCGSTLPSGGTGGFVVQFADGKHYNGTVVVS